MKKMIFAVASLSAMMMAVPAGATESSDPAVTASVFDMSTSYPGIYAKPGENTSFSLDFLNTTGSSIDAGLTVEEMPENWEGFFKGKSGEISKIHVGSSSEATNGLATFNVTIPEGTPEGEYAIVLKANGTNGESDEVELEVNVSEQENGSSTYTAEYPEQKAASGTSFSFSTTLVNNRGTAQSYSLASQAPEGWQVAFTPSGASASVASIDLEAGASETITVKITPPETLTEGDYTIPVTAISSNDSLSTDLMISITGQYKAAMSTPDGRLSFDAYADATKDITVTVSNTGNVALENLNLSVAAPTDWEVTFDEPTIAVLEANTSKDIIAHVKPASDSMTGDYATTITAANDIVTTSADFRVSVKTRTTWGFVAAGIIVVLCGCLGLVFKKYGRR